jgi:hypothetical protein
MSGLGGSPIVLSKRFDLPLCAADAYDNAGALLALPPVRFILFASKNSRD